MERRNGLQWPWHSHQATTWVLFLVFTVSYYKSIAPRLSPGLFVCAQVLYSLISSVTALLCILVTVLDPVDPSAAQEREAREQSRAFDLTSLPKVCDFCLLHTAKTTQHCSHCRKCVAAFDHHCHWVNNCVAGRNYVYFLVLIGSVEGQMLGFVSFGGAVIGDLVNNGDTGELIEVAILLAVLLLALTVLLFNSALVLFHIYLRYNGLTTRAFLKLRKERRKVQPIVQRENSKVSIHMSQDVSLAQIQPSDPLTFHPNTFAVSKPVQPRAALTK